MSKLFIEDTTLSAIGDAIRSKTGGTELIAPLDMPTAIGSIETGGGGGDIETIDLSNKYYYVDFAGRGAWDWAIEAYGNKMIFPATGDGSDNYVYNMFYESKVEDLSMLTIPIGVRMEYMYYLCNNLTKLPKFNNTEPINITQLHYHFNGCCRLREIPSDYFITKIGNTTSAISNLGFMFYDCYSLRELPDLSAFNQIPTTVSAYNAFYRMAFQCCYTLNKIINLPISTNAYSSNAMVGTFDDCNRVEDILFCTQADGTPYVSNWKNQTIDLSYNLGWTSNASNMTNYNSGITADKRVTDDATYAALKDDPDWWTTNSNYSRYNHDSAVRTINSLPDCSGGSGNTITFKGSAGSSTDGGAINTLTEAEIAVAAAKGWTVSLS